MVFNYDDAVSDKIAEGCGLFQIRGSGLKFLSPSPPTRPRGAVDTSRADCDLAVALDAALFEKIRILVPGKFFDDSAQFAHVVNHARQARRG
jgi:hypothetical protein